MSKLPFVENRLSKAYPVKSKLSAVHPVTEMRQQAVVIDHILSKSWWRELIYVSSIVVEFPDGELLEIPAMLLKEKGGMR